MRTRTQIQKNDTAPAAAPASTKTDEELAAEAAAAALVAANATPAAEPAPATPSMDELAARVTEAAKALEPVIETFDAPSFASYVDAQIEAAKTETTEKATARMKALQTAVATAKTAFESSTSIKIPVYHDPWQTDAVTKTISSPTGVTSGTSNVGYPTNVDTAKRAASIAKQLRVPAFAVAYEAAVAHVVAKADGAAPVKKAGEAASMLDKLAAMFGVTLDESRGDSKYCELRWQIGDVISSVQEAHRMETAMARMSALLSGGGAAAPAEPAAEPAEMALPPAAAGEEPPMTEPEAAAKRLVKNAGGNDEFSVRVGAIENADGWPIDMSTCPRVAKSAPKAAEEITF